MESYREFKEKMKEAGNDVKKMNEIINERLQMFADKITASFNPFDVNDEAFILAALNIVRDGFEERCSEEIQDVSSLLMSKVGVKTEKYLYTKK